MSDTIAIRREAARSALQLRRSLSVPRESPVNIFDLASAVGVEVHFMDLPSLEGMFYRGPDPKIILPSLKHRSRGRVSYSCAHELGHFRLGHGTRVDEYVAEMETNLPRTDQEIAADTFAATLLMPRPAVLSRFECRGWQVSSATPVQIFHVAVELDVGYTTLIKHLRYGLELIDDSWMKDRAKTKPKALRESITGQADARRVIVADRHWPMTPLDFEVGDYLAWSSTTNVLLPSHFRQCAKNGEWMLAQAQRPGQAKVELGSDSFPIRIARFGFCGMLRYRHDEDPEVA